MLSRQPAHTVWAGCLLGATMVLASTLGAQEARAHAYLVSSVPAENATVTATPPELTLNYTEGVVPHFCQVSVRGPGDKTIPVGKPQGAPGHPKVLLVPLRHLTSGVYTVSWHAVSTDTHHTAGAFHFTVHAGHKAQ